MYLLKTCRLQHLGAHVNNLAALIWADMSNDDRYRKRETFKKNGNETGDLIWIGGKSVLPFNDFIQITGK